MKVSELRAHEAELGFRPAEMVRWLSPGELWRIGVRVVLSSVFADYADKRELQGSLPAGLLRAPEDAPDSADEIWIDFVADTGDGFDATYTVASLVACEKLEFTPPPGGQVGPEPLPRASLLVLGGDEVYPAASAREYDNRMKGPYRAALRGADDNPLMVVAPGNHDWYDGLTSFLRLFAQGRPMGAGAYGKRAATSPCSCRTGGGCSGWTASSATSSMTRNCGTSSSTCRGTSSRATA